jgi:hypothetical protein
MESDTPRRAAKRKAAATPKTVAAKAPAAPRRSRATAGEGARTIDPELRARMIETAAYFRAERRGFAPGYDIEDWLVAEGEIDSLLTPARSPRKAPSKSKKRGD